MRICSFLALPLVGVGLASSFVTSCGSGDLTCQNPTTAQQTCITCVNTTCGSDIAAVESACPDYVGCAEACNCGDTGCEQKCLKGAGDAGSTCVGAGLGYLDCLQSKCKTQCAGTMF